MKFSPLQLEHYSLLALHVEALPEFPAGDPTSGPLYASFASANFGVTVKTDEVVASGEGEERKVSIELTLQGEPKPDTVDFPYRFQVKVIGFFDDSRLPEERREALAVVNGATMLFGAVRELLLTTTARSLNGPILLPSVSFAEIGAQIIARNAGSQPSDEDVVGP